MTPTDFVSTVLLRQPVKVYRFAGTLDQLRDVLDGAGMRPLHSIPAEMQPGTRMPYDIKGWLFVSGVSHEERLWGARPDPNAVPTVWIGRTLGDIDDARLGRIVAEPIETMPGV